MLDLVEKYTPIIKESFRSKGRVAFEDCILQKPYEPSDALSNGGSWITCPTFNPTHYALWPFVEYDPENPKPHVGRGMQRGDIVTCFKCCKQWFVRDPVRPDIEGIIAGEEQRYLTLLANAEITVTKVAQRRGISEDTVHFLHETHGVPKDVSRAILNLQPKEETGDV